MNTLHKIKSSEASVLIGALIIITVLTAFAGSALYYSSNRRVTMNQTGSWQEALVVAEDGLNMGIEQVQSKLRSSSGAILTGSAAINALAQVSGTFMLPVVHGGDAPITGTANYAITGTSARGHSYFRVRSIGAVQMPGRRSLPMDVADGVLRKLNLGGGSGQAKYSSTTGTAGASSVFGYPGTSGTILTSAAGITLVDSSKNMRTATRTVEAWIAPVLTSDAGIATVNKLDLNNSNLVVDAFDSTRVDRSWPGLTATATGTNVIRIDDPNSSDPNDCLYGQPPINASPTAPFTAGMGIYDANLATSGSTINAKSATIYGDALTNGGMVTGDGGVMGLVRTDYSQTFPTMDVPTWINDATTTTYSKIGTLTLVGGPESAPRRYTASSIGLAGAKVLTFDYGYPGTSTSGTDTTKAWIEIYVSGDVVTKGNAQLDGSIKIIAGVHVTMYAGQSVDLTGNSFTNNSNSALNFTLYGVGPTDPTKPVDYKIGGNSTFFGAIYAPKASITLAGSTTYIGSIVADSVLLSGNTTFFRDVGLDEEADVLGYKTMSWFEDTGPSRLSISGTY